MKHTIPTLILALAGVAAPKAHAFSIGSHREITGRAVALEARAWPILAARSHEIALANVEEDLNLVVKWGLFNHYFNPKGAVRTTWRQTSDVRVEGLWADIERALAEGDEAEVWERAGHLLHHIQDMASPPHVIPVEHNMTDGFERYDIAPLLAVARGRDLPPMGGVEAHRELALRTWSAVEQGRFEACGQSMPWSDYWSGVPGEFGSYGAAGNRFGEAVPCDDEEVAMRAFAKERVDDAVGYSRAFLRGIAARLAG